MAPMMQIASCADKHCSVRTLLVVSNSTMTFSKLACLRLLVVRTQPIPWTQGLTLTERWQEMSAIFCSPSPVARDRVRGWLSSPGRSSPVSRDGQGMTRGWRSTDPGDGSPESGPPRGGQARPRGWPADGPLSRGWPGDAAGTDAA